MEETITMSIPEAAKLVPTGIETMREWVYSGQVPSTPVGKSGKRRRVVRAGFAEAVAAIQSGSGKAPARTTR